MPDLYPALEPTSSGFLALSDRHEMYYEECGNPAGMPVVFLHGGPGSSCNPSQRRYFDAQAFRIILFDQRGCGRSRPRGAVHENTLGHLIADMETLRRHLGIGRWILFGGSWGSTLALAYALRHQNYVAAMVLRGVFLASTEELHWYLEGLRRFVPQAWARFTAGISDPTAASILDHYVGAISGDDRDAAQVARKWNDYESAIMTVGESGGGGSGYDDATSLARVRVQLHYLQHACFLEEPLMNKLNALRVPTIIVQGRRDLVCPPHTAFAVHCAISGSELRMVEEGGHSAMHPAMSSALVQATDGMRACELTA